MKRTFGDASLLGPLFAWMGCQMAYVPQASISGRWCSMRRRGQKVPQELLQARRGFELVGKNIAGRREGCLEFDCPSGLLRTRFLAGVYVTPCLLLLRAGPPMATAFVHVRLAWQVHALPANARTVAHLERMHMLGRACQDASISGTRRARLHTKAIATQGLGVGMGMVQSSASLRSGLVSCNQRWGRYVALCKY